MSSKIATAILTGGLSLASPTYGKIATLGILGDKSKPKVQGGGTAVSTSPLSQNTAQGQNRPKVGTLPLSGNPLGDTSEAPLSRGKLLGN